MATIAAGISSANRSVKANGINFIKAVKCSGILSADFPGIFEVRQDAARNHANGEFNKEKVRTGEEITETKQKIAAAKANIARLAMSIRRCEMKAADYSRTIRSEGSNADRYQNDANRAKTPQERETANASRSMALRRKGEAEAAARANENERVAYVGQKKAEEETLRECEEKKKNLEERLGQMRVIIRLF